MSEKTASTAGADPIVQPYMDFWTGYFNQAAESAQKMFQSAIGGADPRAAQRRWLEAVDRSLDAYMRSPAFLSAMKQNIDFATKAKLRMDDLHKEFARNANIPTATDIGGLYERLRSVEDMILSRLAEIDERLEVAGQGDTTDGSDDSGTSSPKRISPKAKKKPRN